MSTREIELELADVLHRHAEDAMTGTDTHTEHERFREQLEMGADKKPRNRWAVGVALAAAAAVVAGIGVWAVGDQGADRSLPPTQEPEGPSDVEIAQGFLEAYADGDVVRAATYLAPGHEPYPDWEMYVERNAVFGFAYRFEQCEALSKSVFGTPVRCPFDLHIAHSEALGEGPFTGNTFTVYVEDGAVTRADDSIPWETNGQFDYVDKVFGWVEHNYPQNSEFLSLDEPDVPEAQWSRWLRMWDRTLDAYLEAKTGGNAE